MGNLGKKVETMDVDEDKFTEDELDPVDSDSESIPIRQEL
jgi:hypothetical protein